MIRTKVLRVVTLAGVWATAFPSIAADRGFGEVPASGFRSPEGDPRFRPEAGVKPLNNLVFELLNVESPGLIEHIFRNPREGWVYVRVPRPKSGTGPRAQSLIEELAGIKSQGKLLEHVLCAPRWPATNTRKVAVTAHFPASDTYFSYHYDLSEDRLRLHFTGTGDNVSFRLLLPGWETCSGATLDGKKTRFQIERLEQSVYVTLEAQIKGVRELIVAK